MLLKEHSPHLQSLLERKFDVSQVQNITIAFKEALENGAATELDGVTTLPTANPRPARIGVILLKELVINDAYQLISALELSWSKSAEAPPEARLAVWLDRIRHAHLAPEDQKSDLYKELIQKNKEYINLAEASNSPLLGKLLRWQERADTRE